MIPKTSADGEDHKVYTPVRWQTSHVRGIKSWWQLLCDDTVHDEIITLCVPSVGFLSVLFDQTVNKGGNSLYPFPTILDMGMKPSFSEQPFISSPTWPPLHQKRTTGYLITNVKLERVVHLRRKVTSCISHFLIYFGWSAVCME